MEYFWVTPEGVLYAQRGEIEESRLVLDDMVTAVSACRGYSSNLYPDQDQGLVVAYVRDGKPWYRQYIYDSDQQTKRWLDLYFSGKEPDFCPPLDPDGTDFQKTVWSVLRTIPYGDTLTYGEVSKLVAAKLGRSFMSAQAVGGAVGRNPISIIVPCHRVIGADGSLTGYAGGLWRKEKLLRLERGEKEP